MRLVDELLVGEALHQAFFLGAEAERARIAVVSVRGAEDRFRGALKAGLDHLFNQLLRPKLRPILSDVYKDVSYILDEDSYAEAEYRDDVRKRFVKAWEGLLAGYRVSFSSTPQGLDDKADIRAEGIVHADQLQPLLRDGRQCARATMGGHHPRDEVHRGLSPSSNSSFPAG